MNRASAFVSRMLGVVTRRRADAELRVEIQAHLDLLTEEYVRQGLSPEDARPAARREFGGVEQIRQVCRDQRGLRVVDTLAQDLRQGVRLLGRNRAFSAVAVLTLALGIGATVLVFSYVTAVLMAAAPVVDMDQLAGVWSDNRSQGEPKAVGLFRPARPEPGARSCDRTA
jgi:hypothetical protein